MTVALVLVILHGLFMTAVYWTTRQNLGGSSPTVLTILLLCALGVITDDIGHIGWIDIVRHLAAINPVATDQILVHSAYSSC